LSTELVRVADTLFKDDENLLDRLMRGSRQTGVELDRDILPASWDAVIAGCQAGTSASDLLSAVSPCAVSGPEW
jgi:hypothetical protein